MENGTIIQVSAFPSWIVGISYTETVGYRCWVINPELIVLNDGEIYATSQAAMTAGRYFVEHSLELGTDSSNQSLD
ncbi:MAG TPA: hypothetical protein ACFE0H_08170 [Elainellaceae cyanobacterium]